MWEPRIVIVRSWERIVPLEWAGTGAVATAFTRSSIPARTDGNGDAAHGDVAPGFVGDRHVPDPGGAAAVDRRGDGIEDAARGGAQELGVGRLAEADIAVRRDRPVGAAGGERLGDAGVDAAVDDPRRLVQVRLDREPAADPVLPARDHLEPVMGVER